MSLREALARGAALAKVAPERALYCQRIEGRIADVASCYGIPHEEARRIVLSLARRGPSALDVCDSIVLAAPSLDALRDWVDKEATEQ